MIDIYSGDPRLVLGPDGADFYYLGGQPVMDQGVENQALIALFTSDIDPASGFEWSGNKFFKNEQKIGSHFQVDAQSTQTLKQLRVIEKSAIKALEDSIFGEVTAQATNPRNDSVFVTINIGPGDLTVTGNKAQWVAQGSNPTSASIPIAYINS